MNFKKWFLSLFAESNRAKCEYNIRKESFYFYWSGGKITILSLDDLLTKHKKNKIRDKDKKILISLLNEALYKINKCLLTKS